MHGNGKSCEDVPAKAQPRDFSPEANAAFDGPVPAALTDSLKMHEATLVPRLKKVWPSHGALVMEVGPNTFLVAGTGMYLRFACADKAGIVSIWAGKFVDGKWTPRRGLNGDDDNQGRWLQLPSNEFVIRMVKLYHYQ